MDASATFRTSLDLSPAPQRGASFENVHFSHPGRIYVKFCGVSGVSWGASSTAHLVQTSLASVRPGRPPMEGACSRPALLSWTGLLTIILGPRACPPRPCSRTPGSRNTGGEVLECQKLKAEEEEAPETSKLSHRGAIRRFEPLIQEPDTEVVRYRVHL